RRRQLPNHSIPPHNLRDRRVTFSSSQALVSMPGLMSSDRTDDFRSPLGSPGIASAHPGAWHRSNLDRAARDTALATRFSCRYRIVKERTTWLAARGGEIVALTLSSRNSSESG